MITLCQTVGIYAPYEAKRGFIRIYVAFVLFYGLNFNASYQSFLLSVLTTPTYAHQVASIHDTIAYKFDNFTGGENLRAFFDKNDSVSQYLHKVYDPCYVMDKCLEDVKESDKLAVAISRQHAKNAKISLTEDDMFCFEKADNICEWINSRFCALFNSVHFPVSFSVVMLFKRDHHLLPGFNTLIRRIAESGFILKWKADYEYEKFQEDLKKRKRGEIVKPLNLGHLFGCFAVLAVGISLALIGFLVEWLVYFLARRKGIAFVQKHIERKFFFSYMEKLQKKKVAWM